MILKKIMTVLFMVYTAMMGDNIIDVQWFKSEIDRDQQASEQKG
jgi:hypothetical protein